MPPSMPRTGREYLRVSQDDSGELVSPEEQHDENIEHAERNGWELGEPYAEREAVSASRWSDKDRDEFARMLADIEGGRFGADILHLWESSRGSRKVREWLDLIEACERASVLIYVTTHARLYNPKNARDRKSLIDDANSSEYASAETRDRVLRSTASRARKGDAHGRIRYGYTRVYDAANRKIWHEEKHPVEAPLVAELFRRLHAGDSLRSIERDWAERGIMTRGQRNAPPHPFVHVDLRTMALNPAYAGLRVRQPKGTARRRDAIDGAVEAKWPAIVDRETWYAVRALLTDPARRKSRPGRGKHLLSLIGCCDECGATLTVRYRRGERCYGCRAKGCVSVNAGDLDQVAELLIKGWLSRPGAAAMMRPSGDVSAELEAVRGELGKARGDLADWRARAGLRRVSAESFEAIEPVILAEITRLEARDTELSTPPALRDWVGTPAEVASRWGGALMPARRSLARAVLSPVYLGVLRVARVREGGRNPVVPVADRVRLDQGASGQI